MAVPSRPQRGNRGSPMRCPRPSHGTQLCPPRNLQTGGESAMLPLRKAQQDHCTYCQRLQHVTRHQVCGAP
eukprot:1771446-Ditylum_brightwellii.AAC.1